jgi:hypothetical protein
MASVICSRSGFDDPDIRLHSLLIVSGVACDRRAAKEGATGLCQA